MAVDIRIKYVNKTTTHHEHITHLGNDQGTWPLDMVVLWIDNREYTFYTFENGKRANIYVRQGQYRRFVQTQADGAWSNNLLSLPPCVIAAA